MRLFCWNKVINFYTQILCVIEITIYTGFTIQLTTHMTIIEVSNQKELNDALKSRSQPFITIVGEWDEVRIPKEATVGNIEINGTIEGSIENQGTVERDIRVTIFATVNGNIENWGAVEGDIKNLGAVEGNIFNNGTVKGDIKNQGTVEGNIHVGDGGTVEGSIKNESHK